MQSNSASNSTRYSRSPPPAAPPLGDRPPPQSYRNSRRRGLQYRGEETEALQLRPTATVVTLDARMKISEPPLLELVIYLEGTRMSV